MIGSKRIANGVGRSFFCSEPTTTSTSFFTCGKIWVLHIFPFWRKRGFGTDVSLHKKTIGSRLHLFCSYPTSLLTLPCAFSLPSISRNLRIQHPITIAMSPLFSQIVSRFGCCQMASVFVCFSRFLPAKVRLYLNKACCPRHPYPAFMS